EHAFAVGDVAVHEAVARRRPHRLQVGEVPRVGEGVERRHLDARVVGDLVANEVRADEPGAARHQEFHGRPSIAAACRSRGICEHALTRRTGRPQAVGPTGCVRSPRGSRAAPPSTTRSTMKSMSAGGSSPGRRKGAPNRPAGAGCRRVRQPAVRSALAAVDAPDVDPLAEESRALAGISSAALPGRLALGPSATSAFPPSRRAPCRLARLLCQATSFLTLRLDGSVPPRHRPCRGAPGRRPERSWSGLLLIALAKILLTAPLSTSNMAPEAPERGGECQRLIRAPKVNFGP